MLPRPGPGQIFRRRRGGEDSIQAGDTANCREGYINALGQQKLTKRQKGYCSPGDDNGQG
jgi:hypothetical protein